jgi:hypothetical protein
LSTLSNGDKLRRFAVGLSFPGEARKRVAAIATRLADSLGRNRVLYDKFHEAEFARPNLDVYLQDLYHDETTLNVVFLCEAYNQKEWCGLEWRAIRDLIKRRKSEIMFLRVDDGDVAGVFSIDGYVDIRERSDEQAAALITERLQLLQPSAPGQEDAAALGELLLTDAGKLPNGHSALCDVVMTEGESVRVTLEAGHELDFAICSRETYKRWRSTGRLTGCLHLARRTADLEVKVSARQAGLHHVLVINNTRRKLPVPYKLAIRQN